MGRPLRRLYAPRQFRLAGGHQADRGKVPVTGDSTGTSSGGDCAAIARRGCAWWPRRWRVNRRLVSTAQIGWHCAPPLTQHRAVPPVQSVLQRA
jgi:hypothetical protein